MAPFRTTGNRCERRAKRDDSIKFNAVTYLQQIAYEPFRVFATNSESKAAGKSYNGFASELRSFQRTRPGIRPSPGVA